jgi:phage terminase, large subunit, PBSX family
MIEVPELLNIPPKLLPFITELGKYRYYLAEGGRGSGKSNAFARIVLYLCEKRKLRVICGREIQKTIEESVHRLLADLISKYGLNFEVQGNKIVHRKTGSEILFKGFREQGRANIKGLEGVDILWVDEAEAITKQTLDVIIPTVRKPNSVIWFSMNRFVRQDPVYMYCISRSNCLSVHIDYFENPYCPQELINEAAECKRTNEKDYEHIWLGRPMEQASDYLFNAAKVEQMKQLEPFDDVYLKHRVIGVDFAAQGNDLCVATVLDRVGLTMWKCVAQEAWSDADAMSSIGRIVGILGKWRPTAASLDVGGMGYVVYSRLQELKVHINPFDGAKHEGVPHEYLNNRAYGYFTLAEYINNGWLAMKSPETEAELLEIRYKQSSNGKRQILSKDEMRKSGIKSPDRADSLMMAVHTIKNFLSPATSFAGTVDFKVKRKNISKF